MKEFVRTLKQTLQVHGKADIFSYIAVLTGGGIFGILIVFCVMIFAGEGEGYAKIGAVLALVFGIILLFFGGIFSVQGEFNVAISMGKTRKYFVPARYLGQVLNVLVMLAVVMLIKWLEGFVYSAVYPQAVCEFDIDPLLHNVGALMGIIFGAPALVLLFGALLMRFSAQFFWVFWALWMVLFVGGPRIMNAVSKNPDSVPARIGLKILDFAGGISPVQLAVTLILLAAVMMAVTVGLFRKQRVTS